LLRSRYVGLLEGEVCRLRAENRALTNSLLGTAGFPPVEFPEPPKPQPVPRSRRRSWHQIQAWRENEARSVHPDPVGTARDTAQDLESSGTARTNGPVPHS
jgi:hypothetical protein